MNPACFRRLYCTQHQLSDSHFERVLLRRLLYAPANLLRPMMRWNEEFYWEEAALIRDLGEMRSTGQFNDTAQPYRSLLARRRGPRRWFKLRISIGKARAIIERTFAVEQATHAVKPSRSTTGFPERFKG